MRYHLTVNRMAIIKKKKNLQIINTVETVLKREPSYTADGNVNWCSCYGEQYSGSF